jgi:hypothetical protein
MKIMFSRCRSLLLFGILACGEIGNPPDSLPTWTLREMVRIGSIDDPGTSLTAIGDVRFGADERLLVLQPRESAVRVFSLDGTPSGTIGRSGSGPGEFINPNVMGWNGEDMYIIDTSNSRVTFLSSTGDGTATWSPRYEPTATNPLRPGPVALMKNRALLVSDRGLSAPRTGTGPHFQTYYLSDSTGTPIRRYVARPVDNSMFAVTHPDLGGLYGPQPFGDDPVLAVHPSGSFAVVVERATAGARSDTISVMVTLVGPEADTVARTSHKVLATRLLDAEYEAAVRYRITLVLEGAAGTGITSRPRAEQAVRRELYRPSHHSPVGRVIVAGNGTIWLELQEASDSSFSEWLVLNERGKAIARARGPHGARIRDMSGELVAATTTDDLDVPYVHVFQLTRN